MIAHDAPWILHLTRAKGAFDKCDVFATFNSPVDNVKTDISFGKAMDTSQNLMNTPSLFNLRKKLGPRILIIIIRRMYLI